MQPLILPYPHRGSYRAPTRRACDPPVNLLSMYGGWLPLSPPADLARLRLTARLLRPPTLPEIEDALALCGAAGLDELGPDLVRPAWSAGPFGGAAS